MRLRIKSVIERSNAAPLAFFANGNAATERRSVANPPDEYSFSSEKHKWALIPILMEATKHAPFPFFVVASLVDGRLSGGTAGDFHEPVGGADDAEGH